MGSANVQHRLQTEGTLYTNHCYCQKTRAIALSCGEKQYPQYIVWFLPERDYVTFGSLLSQIRLSSVVCLSVTLVHPIQGVEAFGNIFSPLCTLAIL